MSRATPPRRVFPQVNSTLTTAKQRRSNEPRCPSFSTQTGLSPRNSSSSRWSSRSVVETSSNRWMRVLAAWERQHGPLDRRFHEQFQHHRAMAKLVQLPWSSVEMSVRQGDPKLDAILRKALALEVHSPKRPTSKGPSRYPQPPTPRLGFSSGRYQLPPSGAITPYGSGMIRSPERPEQEVGGGVCKSCGRAYRSDGHCACS